jgi:hypothetical protein
MSKRTTLIALGVLLILVSVFADALGLGQEPRFGWKQVIGLVVGVALVVVGMAWRRISH